VHSNPRLSRAAHQVCKEGPRHSSRGCSNSGQPFPACLSTNKHCWSSSRDPRSFGLLCLCRSRCLRHLCRPPLTSQFHPTRSHHSPTLNSSENSHLTTLCSLARDACSPPSINQTLRPIDILSMLVNVPSSLRAQRSNPFAPTLRLAHSALLFISCVVFFILHPTGCISLICVPLPCMSKVGTCPWRMPSHQSPATKNSVCPII
jgi:hypothetical protein